MDLKVSQPLQPHCEPASGPAGMDWRPRYTLVGLLALLTAIAGVLGLLRWDAALTVAWLVATVALYGSLGIVISHRAAWRRPRWVRVGACDLATLAAGVSAVATVGIDPGLAIAWFFAALVIGVCLTFQLGIGEALLTVFALFLPARFATLLAGFLVSLLIFGPR